MSHDQAVIVSVAAVCALGTGVLGLVFAWLVRHRSIRWQFGLVVGVAVGSMLLGVLAISRMMFISVHDRQVVTLVVVVSGLVSLAVAAACAVAVARWSEGLRRRVGDLGAHGSFVEVHSGPSELRRLSDELARTSASLEESRRRESRLEGSRRELVSWVSHDLRTPLAGMRAMTEALEDGLAPDPAGYHRRIRIEVDRMAGMVDDLFELSRIQAGVLPLAPEPLLVRDLLSEAIAGAEPVARARSVRLGGYADEGVAVTGDPAALSRVLTNLLMNAIRHTAADGSVEVRGRAVPEGVEISVRDHCGGLREEEMRRVFDLAWRGEASRSPASTDQPGAGLGLAIVKGIVEAHRGVVSVENVAPAGGPPTGCRFLVRLPG